MTKKFSDEKKYIGNLSQLFDVRQYKLIGGKADGVNAIEIWNGDALSVTILPDRGMDIYSVRYNNHEMAYQAPSGIVHPSFYNDVGPKWLRTFQGGFLATCGVEWIGGANPDIGEGLHGRHNHTPAEQVCVSVDIENGEPTATISGVVRHALLFGVRYTLKRTYKFRRGENSFTFTDEITNNGFTEKPLYLLYHFNLGYPLISEDTELLINSTNIEPANDFAAPLLPDWNKMTSPEPDYKQRNYYHYLEKDKDGYRRYAIKNNSIDTVMNVSFRSPFMDRIFQWKNLAAGDYIMGLEPTGMHIGSKDVNEAPHLMPDETLKNEFEFRFDPAK
ncbi:MAG: DUF4432 family protein [Clostridia bacterium]|nr:DUF4432 family protein [Clostridia bacterium]